MRLYVLCVSSVQGFMAKDSRELLNQLKSLFDTIVTFTKAQEHLYTTALREVHEEKMRQQTIERRTLEVRCISLSLAASDCHEQTTDNL